MMVCHCNGISDRDIHAAKCAEEARYRGQARAQQPLSV